MALAPVAYFSDPLEDYPNQFIKFFEQGTTTPLSMATDSTGGTTLAKAEISGGGTVPIGFIKTAGDAIFIPWVDGDYDLWIFPTAAEADANDTSNAIQIANDINSDRSNAVLRAADKRYSAVFGSVASMVALTMVDGGTYTPLSGQSVYLTSYRTSIPFTEPQGGGGHFRIMTLAEYALTPDEIGAAFTIGGLAFVRDIGSNVDVRDFGVAADGDEDTGLGTDDTVSYQAAIDFLASRGDKEQNTGGTLLEPEGFSMISGTIYYPLNVRRQGVAGYGTTFVPLTGAVFDNGYMFSMNSSDQVTWDTAFTGQSRMSVRMMSIDNTINNVANVRGFFSAGTIIYEELRARGLENHITTSNDYADNIKIRSCQSHETTSGGTVPIYNLGLLGDGLFIDGASLGAQTGEILIQVVGCAGGVIQNCIGGSIVTDRCDALTIDGYHTEGGNVQLKRSSVTVKNSFLAGIDDTIGVVMSDGSIESNNSVVLDNVTFIYYLDEFASTTLDENDVKLDFACSVTIRDCRRRIFKNGVIDVSEQCGIRVVDSSDVSVDDFNDFSHLLSVDGHIYRRGFVRRTRDTIECGSGNFSVLANNTGSNDRVKWQDSTDTYFYQVQYLYDVRRLIGKTNSGAEFSIARTFGGDGVLLAVETGARPMSCMVRLYRGLATGSYNRYIDVPAVSMTNIFDSGNRANGFFWIVRTAGAVDSISDQTQAGGNQDHYIGYDSVIPSGGGNFIPGDRVINTDVAVGNPKAWTNTVASASDGDAGTWVSEGNL